MQLPQINFQELLEKAPNLRDKLAQAIASWKSPKNRQQAKKLLSDQRKLEEFLTDIEHKLAHLPFGMGNFAAIPGLISLLSSYIHREYKDIPLNSILAAIGALIYFLTPLDIIPDFIVGIGVLDDAFVLNACLEMIGKDVKKYRQWQEEQQTILHQEK